MSDTANAATEVVADVAEEVAEQATQLAQASRGLSSHDLSLVLGGLIVGAGLGGAIGYVFAKYKLETKYSQLAAEEISEMRVHYTAKAVALESESNKADLESIVRDKGYVPKPSEPPMVVSPPVSVVEAAQEAVEETPELHEQEDTPSTRAPEERNIFRDNEVQDDWDYAKERARRSPMAPYVIHREERDENAAYDSVTFTYYEEDDVLCNENDDVISEDERMKLVGEANLEKFGHGSGEADIVYIRNDSIEVDFEIVRSSGSYAQEVHGLEPTESSGLEHSSASHRRERKLSDDE